jgi:DNA modification methylase
MPAIAWSLQRRPLSSLTEWPDNPRCLTTKGMADLKRSIEKFGCCEPLVINTDGMICGGHGRKKTLEAMGVAEVDCYVPERALDKKEFEELNIRLNQNISGEWDFDKLANVFDMAELTDWGFDEAQLVGAFNEITAGNTEDNAIPETPKEPVCNPGDLWVMGGHRLLCGDSTNVQHVERLMAGEKAVLMNTDPPYGISFDNAALGTTRKEYDKIANDELHDKELQSFLESVFSLAAGVVLVPNAAWYLWHAHLTQGFFAAAAAAAAAVILHRQIIWVKPRLILGRGQYQWKHEPCFMGWIKGNQPPDYGLGHGERTQTTVWEIDGVSKSCRDEFDHASPKPVQLFEIPLVKHTKPNEICYEPFAGTGPQFIAAEKTGRRCFGLEIEPKYADVILKRWANFTGKQPVRDDGVKWGEACGG